MLFFIFKHKLPIATANIVQNKCYYSYISTFRTINYPL